MEGAGGAVESLEFETVGRGFDGDDDGVVGGDDGGAVVDEEIVVDELGSEVDRGLPVDGLEGLGGDGGEGGVLGVAGVAVPFGGVGVEGECGEEEGGEHGCWAHGCILKGGVCFNMPRILGKSIGEVGGR